MVGLLSYPHVYSVTTLSESRDVEKIVEMSYTQDDCILVSIVFHVTTFEQPLQINSLRPSDAHMRQ